MVTSDLHSGTKRGVDRLERRHQAPAETPAAVAVSGNHRTALSLHRHFRADPLVAGAARVPCLLLLFAAWVAFIAQWLDFIPLQYASRELLDNLGMFHFGGYYILSAAALAWTFWQVHLPELRRQLRWIMLGTAAAFPYFLFQALSQ